MRRAMRRPRRGPARWRPAARRPGGLECRTSARSESVQQSKIPTLGGGERWRRGRDRPVPGSGVLIATIGRPVGGEQGDGGADRRREDQPQHRYALPAGGRLRRYHRTPSRVPPRTGHAHRGRRRTTHAVARSVGGRRPAAEWNQRSGLRRAVGLAAGARRVTLLSRPRGGYPGDGACADQRPDGDGRRRGSPGPPPGETALYLAHRPHRYSNLGEVPVLAMVVVAMPPGGSAGGAADG